MTVVAVIGTCDTKLQELLFLRDQIQADSSIQTIFIDVGRHPVEDAAITKSQVQILQDYQVTNWEQLPRGEYIKLISQHATSYVKDLQANGKIHGIVCAGGSGGTSLASAMMRALPIGFPKLIVSTIASGNTADIIGESDIALMYSVVDVAGMNQLLRDVLSNAGASIGAAAKSYAIRSTQSATTAPSTKKQVGITMFGVTTQGVDVIRKTLEEKWPIETYVFHATGTGGRAMERLTREGKLDAVIDLTTTEVADYVMDGVMSAGETRLDAAAEAGIPAIVSLGATDMANFGARNTLPVKYEGRNILEHNALVTLVRSNAGECIKIGEFIAAKLHKAKLPEKVQLWVPRGGVSIISTPGGPFEDKEADDALFNAVTKGLAKTGIKIVNDSRDINDAEFAKDIAHELAKMLGF